MAEARSDSEDQESPAERVPVCFRHPSRETWVSCVRCERPICPDCMNPAAVGFQCPECVRGANRGTRQVVTPFGGAVATTASREGLVTRVLIGMNVVAWLATVVVAVLRHEVTGEQLGQLVLSGGLTDIPRWGAALPVETLANGSYSGGIASGELWRLFTPIFLHYGILHLALNSYALWLLGQHCEHLLGRWRFLALYLLSGIGGNVAVFLFDSPNTYAVGASGSIFGLMAALFFFFRKLKTDVRSIAALLILNLVLGMFFVSNLSVLAHVGGMVVGGLVGAALAYAPSGKQQAKVQLAALVAISVVLVGLTAIRIAQYGLLL